jgi:hypothetical protein
MFGPTSIVPRKPEAARSTASRDDVGRFDPLSANVGSMSRKPTNAVIAVARPQSELPMPTHDEVSLRAYHIWLDSGRTHGHDQSDWEQARQQLLSERSLVEPAV